MFKSLAILPLLLITAQAAGTFSILEHPDSILFKGNDRLDSNYVGDVLGACLGLYIDADTKWSGLFINNPFQFPKGVINIMVEGVNGINLNQKAKTFPIAGGDAVDSLDTMSSTVEALNSPAINVNLNRGLDSLLTYTDILGNLQIPTSSKYAGNLKPDAYQEDKLFLQQIAAIKALSNKTPDIQNKPTFINIRISLKPIIDAHGINSPAFTEAMKILSKTIEDFSEKSNKAYGGQLLFTVITDDSIQVSSRSKRQAQKASDANELNLAASYNEDYPVIFNIILWFMIVFVFALLAISYVIGTMDPGRDSIIYRMTSTRMKKDN